MNGPPNGDGAPGTTPKPRNDHTATATATAAAAKPLKYVQSTAEGRSGPVGTLLEAHTPGAVR